MTYLPDDLLVKADIASMASSLELRSPMLDHRVISLGLSLPAAAKVDRRQGKVILREAFGDLLPAEVFSLPKRGFGVPLGRWLREDLFETLREALMDPGLHGLGIFRPEALAGLLNDHFSGRGDHRHRLWALLVLARWLATRG
jgi:asparagine synthase (glutamine-hydrolysing)